MNALDAVTEYFRHNTIPLHFNEVSNAWNIGGPFEEVEHLNGKIKRAEQCTSHDYSSLFNSVVTWDPDTPIKAIEICADIPSGPEKM
jgi:hypothetical protein